MVSSSAFLSPDSENDRWIQIEDQSTPVVNYLKAAAAITTFAVAILASAYLAYKNPGRWWLASLSIGVINLYTLPKFLRYGNPTIIRFALAVNLAALSCLSLGGISIASVSLSRWMITSFKAYQLSNALFSTFFITGLIGYGVPFFQESLKKAFHLLLQDTEIQERLETMSEQFHRQPEIGLGLLQSNLWQSFVLHLMLFKPEFIVTICQIFEISLPNYAWPMATAINEKMDVEQFNDLLLNMEHLADNLSIQQEELTAEMQENYRLSLKIALKSLSPSDLSLVIPSLLSRGAKLIPIVLSNMHFLKLFAEDALDATNNCIQTFLDLIDTWDEVMDEQRSINLDAIHFERELQQYTQPFSSQEEEVFGERYEKLSLACSQLRKKVEKIYFNKRVWQDFAPLWENNHEMELPFENSETLLDTLRNQSLLKEIDDLHHLLIGTGQGAQRTIHDRLQYIKNKLVTLRLEEEEEETSVIMHLATHRGFIKTDYDDLQTWLNVDSPHDLEDAMVAIGLATEEDLYEKNILPREGLIDKGKIRDNLQHYIEKVPKSHLADRIQPKDEIDQQSFVSQSLEKVTRIVFHVISAGLILVPIFIQPVIGGSGFALGLCFFALKRFEIPGMQTIGDTITDFIDNIPLGDAMRALLSRRAFSVNTYNREAANRFVNANLYARMRIINLQILITLVISHFSFRFESPFLGSFSQGIALADEIVSLI